MVVSLVVFDMDDTLFLEQSYVESGFRAVSEMLLTEHNYQSFFHDAWSLFQSGRRGDIFDAVLLDSMRFLPLDIIEHCVDTYRNHVPRIELLNDSLDLIHACRAQFNTGLVTDGPRSSQRAKIRSLKLSDLIDRVVVTDEHGEGWSKPGHCAFQSLQRAFDVPGNQCVYIGDNPRKDFIAPRELGWRTVRVRRSGGLHENLESADDAELEVPDLTQESVAAIGFLHALNQENEPHR